MAYCTVDQLTDRYGQRFLVELSDRGEAPADTIDADLFARVIADADALIDGYLKPVYLLPLEAVPPLLADLAQAIAIYKAHSQQASDKITEDYREAVRTLRDISSGKIKRDSAGAEPVNSGDLEVITHEPERPFTQQSMKGFI